MAELDCAGVCVVRRLLPLRRVREGAAAATASERNLSIKNAGTSPLPPGSIGRVWLDGEDGHTA
jgi:hypothetical protein